MRLGATAPALLLVACGATGVLVADDEPAGSPSSSSSGGASELTTSSSGETTAVDGDDADDDVDDGTHPPEPVCGEGTAPGGEPSWLYLGSEKYLPNISPYSRLAAMPTGEIMIAGGADYNSAGNVQTVMFSGEAEPLWADTYVAKADLGEEVLDVAVDRAGFVHVLVSEPVSVIWAEDYVSVVVQLVVLRYGPGGAKIWRFVRPPPDDAGGDRSWVPGALGITEEAEVVVIEAAWSEPTWRLRLDEHGNLVDETSLQVDRTLSQSFAIDPAGGDVYVVHERHGTSGAIRVERTNAEGEVEWVDAFGGADDRGIQVATGGDGSLTLFWYARLGTGAREYWLTRYETTGRRVFTHRLEGPEGLVAEALGVHCNGDILVAGTMPPNGLGPWLSRYTPDGIPIWLAVPEPVSTYSDLTVIQLVGHPEGDVLASGWLGGEFWFGRFGGT